MTSDNQQIELNLLHTTAADKQFQVISFHN